MQIRRVLVNLEYRIMASESIKQNPSNQKLLFEAYYDILIKIAFRYVGTYEQAVEVTHYGFLKIFHELMRRGINQNEKFIDALSGWIKRIFIISTVERIKSAPELHYSKPIPEELWKQQDSVLSETDFKYIELIKILKELPISHRLVFNLCVIDGFSHNEIAKMLGISMKDLNYKLIMARRYCYRSLAERNP
jgi:RNA polymerase sigma factor (sigma-70 family)